MSKERSEFEGPEPDFIENIDSLNTSKHAHQTEEEFDAPFVFTLNHALSFIALFAGYLADTFIADLTHFTNSTIANDIGQPPNGFYWILTIPTLVGAILAPVAGRASDMYGRKYIQLAASVFGIIGSAIAGTTESMRVLMVASAIYGIGYAGHQLALASIVETLPRRHRALTIGIFMGALIPAAGFSPLIGAAFTVHSSWRASFWLSLGLYSFSLIGTLLFYHPQQIIYRETESVEKSLMQFDYIGAFLMIAGITTVAVGLIFGGTVYPWISAGVFVPTFLGIAVIAVFIAWVVFNRLQYPFIPRSFRLRYWLMLACIFFIGMVCSTTIGLWPQQAQILYTQKQIPLGLFQTAYGVAECLFALIAGLLFFPKQARWILTGYSTILFIVSSAQAIVDKDTAVGSTILSGFNGAMHSAVIVVTTAMIQLTVNHEDLGMATNLAFSAYNFGGVAYGIIDQVIVKNHLQKEAIALIVPALYEAGIPLSDLLVAVPAFLAGQLTNPVFANASPAGLLAAGEAMKGAYVHVLHYVYLISILFGGLLVVVSVFQRSVDTPVTSHVDVRLGSFRNLVLSKTHHV